jgi:hypothetical protein
MTWGSDVCLIYHILAKDGQSPWFFHKVLTRSGICIRIPGSIKLRDTLLISKLFSLTQNPAFFSEAFAAYLFPDTFHKQSVVDRIEVTR